MIKKEIYPKTKRVSCKGDKVYLTEKIDGSNLVFFKKDDKLYFAQRNNIICNNSAICGEWIGMGCLKYNVDEFDKRWYMFAKANIDDDYNLYNLIYDHELFIYPFVSQEIPNFIGIVPEVTELINLPNKEQLDSIYEKYKNKVNRNVEGFVINYKNIISKYVRMKNGQLKEHFDRGE